MNCCDYNCTQGRNCPVRKVKAGAPPPDDLPIQFAGPEPDYDDPRGDVEIVLIILMASASVALLILSVWNLL
jgi:hypothetical protein